MSRMLYYHDVMVGESVVDPLVEDVLPVVLKTVKALDDAHLPRTSRPGRLDAMQE